MTVTQNELLTTLLQQVSRSFYLTLRVLPAGIRRPIGLAYLLARATDTIADTGLLPLEERLAALRRFQDRIRGVTQEPLEFSGFLQHQGSAAERRLLENAETAIGLLEDLDRTDRQRVSEVLAVITSGQELDLRRFDGAAADRLIALQTMPDLDDYTYRVAGCVGEFWTRMCRTHLFPTWAMDEAWLLDQGIRFGKGLQLVNILRDLPADLRQGRCYIPVSLLEPAGLQPAQLLDPANEPKFRPVYRQLLDLSEAHLCAGWAYTKALPRSQVRLRLACAWPILIGLETLGKLRAANVLDASQPVKISRPAVRRLVLRSLLVYPSRARWENLPSALLTPRTTN